MSGIFGSEDKSGEMTAQAAADARARYDEGVEKARAENAQYHDRGRGDLEDYYGKGQEYLDPYRAAGKTGLDAYLDSLGLGAEGSQDKIIDKFRNSPGYQYALDQSERRLERKLNARGMNNSGAFARALQENAMGLADQNYGAYQDRLNGLAGAGQNAATNSAQGAFQTGQNLNNNEQYYAGMNSNLRQGQAQSAAESALAEGNARVSAYQNNRNRNSSFFSQALQGAGYLFGGPAGGAAAGAAGKGLGM